MSARTRSAAAGVGGSASGRSKAAAGAAGVAAGVYFLDPRNGKRRRNAARDRLASIARRGRATAKRQAENRRDKAAGTIQPARSESAPGKSSPEDQGLAERVKSELFRPADAPKGSVNVNVEAGVVYLRGEVEEPEQQQKLVTEAARVDGVKGVENLLHLPGAGTETKKNGQGSRTRA